MQINLNTDNKTSSVAGKLGGTIFFSIFMFMGLFFLIMMIRSLCEKMDWAVAGFLMLPVIFIIVGAGGIYFTWKKKTAEVKTGAAAVEKVNPKNQRVFLALFFSVFFSPVPASAG